MTPAEIANKYQMLRYKTPNQPGGVDNHEFYHSLTADIQNIVDGRYMDLINEWCSRYNLTFYEEFGFIGHSSLVKTDEVSTTNGIYAKLFYFDKQIAFGFSEIEAPEASEQERNTARRRLADMIFSYYFITKTAE